MDDFKLKVQAQMDFNEIFGARKAAEFSVHLQETIEGLTKNNISFVETYHKQNAEIRRLRHALERVKAVWEDVHDETSIVGIVDNALGLNELTEEELLLIWESENIPLEDRFK